MFVKITLILSTSAFYISRENREKTHSLSLSLSLSLEFTTAKYLSCKNQLIRFSVISTSEIYYLYFREEDRRIRIKSRDNKGQSFFLPSISCLRDVVPR